MTTTTMTAEADEALRRENRRRIILYMRLPLADLDEVLELASPDAVPPRRCRVPLAMLDSMVLEALELCEEEGLSRGDAARAVAELTLYRREDADLVPRLARLVEEALREVTGWDPGCQTPLRAALRSSGRL